MTAFHENTDNATDWLRWRRHWTLPDDVTYLNHGSFGPSPSVVQRARQEWMERLERQPMDFFLRQCEDHFEHAAQRLGELVGAEGRDLIFVDNVTTGMNVVAANVDLQPGDEVLTTDHEYGAVLRVWRLACRRAGAELIVRSLPTPMTSQDELVQSLFEAVGEKTRLLVVSHVTSPTATIFPLEAICRRARERGVRVCVDGAHAPAMISVDLSRVGCDYYVASCHKWLCAPFGTGFLYVARGHQQGFQPLVTSWGRSISGRQAQWKDEFNWAGTRDLSGFLSIPTAIDFLQQCGWQSFRRRTHELARYARRRLSEVTGREALTPDSPAWYGSMVTVPLPELPYEAPKHGERDLLQEALWEQHRIEVIVNRWRARPNIRISCHLYNRHDDIDRVANALTRMLGQSEPRAAHSE